jgi:hypothetical protein
MNASSRRYLSVWLKRLSTDRIERRSTAPADTPLVIVEPVKSALRICAFNDAAAALGLKMWMPLADARAMHPSVQVENADPQSDRALLETVADWCDRYTPLVGLPSRKTAALPCGRFASLPVPKRSKPSPKCPMVTRIGARATA